MADLQVNVAIAFYLGKVAYTPQKEVGNTRGSPAPAGDFRNCIRCDGYLQDLGLTKDDAFKGCRCIIVQAGVDAKP